MTLRLPHQPPQQCSNPIPKTHLRCMSTPRVVHQPQPSTPSPLLHPMYLATAFTLFCPPATIPRNISCLLATVRCTTPPRLPTCMRPSLSIPFVLLTLM